MIKIKTPNSLPLLSSSHYGLKNHQNIMHASQLEPIPSHFKGLTINQNFLTLELFTNHLVWLENTTNQLLILNYVDHLALKDFCEERFENLDKGTKVGHGFKRKNREKNKSKTLREKWTFNLLIHSTHSLSFSYSNSVAHVSLAQYILFYFISIIKKTTCPIKSCIGQMSFLSSKLFIHFLSPTHNFICPF